MRNKPKAHTILAHPKRASWDFILPLHLDYDVTGVLFRPLFRAPFRMQLRGASIYAAQQAQFTGEIYVTDEGAVKTYADGYLSGEVYSCFGNAPVDSAFGMRHGPNYGDIIEKGDMLFTVMSSCLGSGPSGGPAGHIMFTLHAERLDEE
jgi:hypothetical protein